MLRLLSIFSLSVILFASCTTFKSLPEDKISTIVEQILKEKSNVDGLELSLSTDYTRDRITLIRMNITSVDGKGTTRTTIAPDSMLGIYFGNGLFLDNNENLVIIPNRLLNIGENFVGKSVYSGYTFTAAGGQPIERVSTFSNGKIEIKAKGIILGDQQIEYNSKSASGNGETIYFNEKNTKIRPTVFVPVISFEYVWEKKQTSLRKTWGLLKSNEYTLVNQRIIDKEKRILVENNGTYLRFAYTKGNKYAFRVYRSKACVLIINENTGDVTVIDVVGKKLEWQQNEYNLMGKTTNILNYSYEIVN